MSKTQVKEYKNLTNFQKLLVTAADEASSKTQKEEAIQTIAVLLQWNENSTQEVVNALKGHTLVPLTDVQMNDYPVDDSHLGGDVFADNQPMFYLDALGFVLMNTLDKGVNDVTNVQFSGTKESILEIFVSVLADTVKSQYAFNTGQLADYLPDIDVIKLVKGLEGKEEAIRATKFTEEQLSHYPVGKLMGCVDFLDIITKNVCGLHVYEVIADTTDSIDDPVAAIADIDSAVEGVASDVVDVPLAGADGASSGAAGGDGTGE